MKRKPCRCVRVPLVLLSLTVNLQEYQQADSLLLNELPTPSFLVDMRALRKRHPIGSSNYALHLPKNDVTFYPLRSGDSSYDDLDFAAPSITVDLVDNANDAALGYFHTSVVRARYNNDDGNEESVKAFLAELDLKPTKVGADGARVVLGLNNHHVGSYYWARSAGAGSSMDAIGVRFNNIDGRGIICWEDERGASECNSNDGKRSEWCNFLRIGDSVQLVPKGDTGEDSLLSFGCAYGISMEGRPLGSEPAVVCEWRRDPR